MQLRSLAVAGIFALTLSACGTYKTYRLPVAAHEAPATFAPIASAADELGLEYAELPTAINVRYDPHTWIYFTIQNDAYNMVIAVGDEVPSDQAPARAAAAKQKGDELWALAMAKRREASERF